MKKEKIRAIYIGDVQFDTCVVFELNEENDYFEMVGDTEFRYPREGVIQDEDFILFKITKNEDESEDGERVLDFVEIIKPGAIAKR